MEGRAEAGGSEAEASGRPMEVELAQKTLEEATVKAKGTEAKAEGPGKEKGKLVFQLEELR